MEETTTKKKRKPRLTAHEKKAFTLLRTGGCYLKKHIGNDGEECFRLLTDTVKPILGISMNQFNKLRRGNRIIFRDHRWRFNPDWHGNKKINRTTESVKGGG